MGETRRVRPAVRSSEVAFLREGPRAAVLAALAALRVDGLVDASYGRMVRSTGQVEPGRDPVERAVHAAALDAPVRVSSFVTNLMVAIELDEVQAAVARNGPRHLTTWARRHELHRLRRQHPSLAPDLGSSTRARPGNAQDAAMAVALFGEAALVALDPVFAAAVVGPSCDQAPRRWFRNGDRPAERPRLRADGSEPGAGLSHSPSGGGCGG